MDEALLNCALEEEEVLDAEQSIVEAEQEAAAKSLQDIDRDLSSDSDGNCMEDSDEGILI